jgi:hypothetical protein
VKVRVIASRPGVSAQPESSANADFRASADSRSAMFVSRFRPPNPNTGGRAGDPCSKQAAAGNHDGDVIMDKREILLGYPHQGVPPAWNCTSNDLRD